MWYDFEGFLMVWFVLGPLVGLSYIWFYKTNRPALDKVFGWVSLSVALSCAYVFVGLVLHAKDVPSDVIALAGSLVMGLSGLVVALQMRDSGYPFWWAMQRIFRKMRGLKFAG